VKRRKIAKGKGKATEKDNSKLKKSKAAVKRKAKRDSGSDDYEDSEDDEYNAPARGLFSPSKQTADPSARPPNGSIEECAECGKDFTVVGVPERNYFIHP
jgi:DNA repair protein RAD7